MGAILFAMQCAQIRRGILQSEQDQPTKQRQTMKHGGLGPYRRRGFWKDMIVYAYYCCMMG